MTCLAVRSLPSRRDRRPAGPKPCSSLAAAAEFPPPDDARWESAPGPREGRETLV